MSGRYEYSALGGLIVIIAMLTCVISKQANCTLCNCRICAIRALTFRRILLHKMRGWYTSYIESHILRISIHLSFCYLPKTHKESRQSQQTRGTLQISRIVARIFQFTVISVVNIKSISLTTTQAN